MFFVKYGAENGANGHHLALFSIDSFSYHFMAPHQPPTFHPYTLVALAKPVKLPKMARNSSS